MTFAHTSIAALTLAFCATPHWGLRAYLVLGTHQTSTEVAIPAPWVLGGLFVAGVLAPIFGVVSVLRRVLKDRIQFQLVGLLEAYGAIILIFASSYSIVRGVPLNRASQACPSCGPWATRFC